MDWVKYTNPLRNIENYSHTHDIPGSRTLSSGYMNKYKPIVDIWGYTSHPYINYEHLTHSSYQGHSLRLFQYLSDPLMRNLQRLSQAQSLVAHDTTDFLITVYDTIDFLEQHEDADYIKWFCTIVLPHFLKQSNISTLLYELADQKWYASNPNFNDEHVLLFLSLVARLFLLLVLKKWEDMRELLQAAGITAKVL